MADSTPAFNPLPLKDADGGALNLTRFTGLGAALVVVLTTFNGAWNTIFGTTTPNWAKPVVIISVIATFAVVAAADILGRSYAAGRRGAVIPMPAGLAARYTVGTDQRVNVAAVRYPSGESGEPEFLILKADNSTSWVGDADLNFANVSAT